jgi:hypothetical protein
MFQLECGVLTLSDGLREDGSESIVALKVQEIADAFQDEVVGNRVNRLRKILVDFQPTLDALQPGLVYDRGDCVEVDLLQEGGIRLIERPLLSSVSSEVELPHVTAHVRFVQHHVGRSGPELLLERVHATHHDILVMILLDNYCCYAEDWKFRLRLGIPVP